MPEAFGPRNMKDVSQTKKSGFEVRHSLTPWWVSQWGGFQYSMSGRKASGRSMS